MSISGQEAMQDALEICGGLGFEMVPGFSTHWPMVCDALVELGAADLVHDWAVLYPTKRKHLPMPAKVEKIDGSEDGNWREALGDFRRAGDWQDYFRARMVEEHWRNVLVRWWGRLLPGMASGLTHGMIRTMHAVRSIGRANGSPSPAQLRELASGLGYWASLYVEQPGAHRLLGDERFPEIIAAVPRVGPEVKLTTRDKGLFHHMPALGGWAEAISRLEEPGDLGAALSDMTQAYVQVNLVHEKTFPIPLIHTVTAPAAVRLMLDHLPETLHIPSYLAVWEATAAILANFAPAAEAEIARDPPDEAEAPPTPDELRARALAHGDEHAVKFTEACLREYALRPDPRYLLAPARVMPKILRYFR